MCKETKSSQKWICTCNAPYDHRSRIGEIGSSSRVEGASQFVINLDVAVPVIEKSKLFAEFYEDADLTDFHLSAADGTVPVHGLVMAAHSDTFKTMLSGDWKEKEKATVELKDHSRQTLQHLKDFMYLGTLPDKDVELERLLLLATRHQVLSLKQACIGKLTQMATPDNYFGILEFAFDNRALVPELMLSLIDLAANNKLITECFWKINIKE